MPSVHSRPRLPVPVLVSTQPRPQLSPFPELGACYFCCHNNNILFDQHITACRDPTRACYSYTLPAVQPRVSQPSRNVAVHGILDKWRQDNGVTVPDGNSSSSAATLLQAKPQVRLQQAWTLISCWSHFMHQHMHPHRHYSLSTPVMYLYELQWWLMTL